MNPKLSRVAHELLLCVALNCSAHTPMDLEVIAAFAKLRFKNKPNVNLYLQCAREIAAAHPDNLPALVSPSRRCVFYQIHFIANLFEQVKHTIFNELSNARNTNNMAVLGVLFFSDGERAAASLAAVFVELLLQRECYLRALRVLLREIVRALRHDINLQIFCLRLMQERPKEQVKVKFSSIQHSTATVALANAL